MHSISLIILAGAVGSLASELLKDNCVELPKKIGARFSLGILGSIIIGAIAGYYVDGSPETAFMAGFMGPQLLAAVLKKRLGEINITEKEQDKKDEKTKLEKIEFKSIEEMIRYKAISKNIDPDLAVAVARCESGLKPSATNVNEGGSIDRGLYQWNNKYHPEITDEMAFNPEIATDLFIKAVKQGHLNWWSASAKCWNAKNKYSY